MGRAQLFIALVAVTFALLTDLVQSQPKFLGVISLPYPAHMNIFTHTGDNPTRKYSLLVNTYSTERNSYDTAYMVQHPGDHIASNFTDVAVKSIYNFLYWGKEIQQIPTSVLDTEAILNFDGSTISGKATGSVYITDMTDYTFPATYNAASTLVPESFMYSNGIWKDINLINSRDDIMACRVQLVNGQQRYSQFVWLEHPRNGFKDRWSIHVLKESACDTSLALTSLKVGLLDTYEVIYATGQYTQRLVLFWTSGFNNNWSNPDDITTGVLETGREYYDLTIVDVNRDGNVDILFTVISQTGGSVEVYEIPNDFRLTESYKNHVIASGFDSRNGGAAGRSPGIARAFYPTTSTNQKPYIMVAGADDGRAYVLRPISQSANDWGYEKIVVVDSGPNEAVVGMTAADINGNGGTELFVSLHDQDAIRVYTFDPEISTTL